MYCFHQPRTQRFLSAFTSNRTSVRLRLSTLVLSALLIALLSACADDIGRFDENEVAAQATTHMKDKYGLDVSVLNTWEDKTYSLFSYTSLDRVFCEMSDGTQVIVPIGEKRDEPIVDNKQSKEICDEVYDSALQEILDSGQTELANAGYTVSAIYINGFSPDAFDSYDYISLYDWESQEGSFERSEEDASEASQSQASSEEELDNPIEEDATRETPFFHSYYNGDRAAFLQSEAQLVDLGVLQIQFVISGPDADYTNGIPINASPNPRWTSTLERVGYSISELCSNRFYGYISAYQTGYVVEGVNAGGASYPDDSSGFLGELTYNRDSHDWLIVNWVNLGHGIWITSDEEGVSLEQGDVDLVVDTAPNYTDLNPEGVFVSDYPRSFDSNALECYSLSLADKKSAEIIRRNSDSRRDWISARIAYDNTDPACGLPSGTAIADLSPSLYLIEIEEVNEGEGSSQQNPEEKYSLSGMARQTMANGWQQARCVLYVDKPTTYVRF